jgi:hypothetical protein
MIQNRPLMGGLVMLSLMAMTLGCDLTPTATPLAESTNTPETSATIATPDTDVIEPPSDAGTPDANPEVADQTQNVPDNLSAAATQDRIIIPGQRVGPVTAETSRADLAEIYSEAILADQPIAMGEGTTEPGTVVDLGPADRFAIVWTDANQTTPLLAKDFGPNWQTPEGLGVGIPYATLEAVLGSFTLYGFAWDYEGSLVLEGSNLDQYYGDLLLRVRPAETAIKAHADAYQAVLGDALYPSEDPNLDALDLSVYDMTVYLNSLTGE